MTQYYPGGGLRRWFVELTAQVSPLRHSAVRKKLASARMSDEDPSWLEPSESLLVGVPLRFLFQLGTPATFLKAKLKQVQLVTSCCLFGCSIIASPVRTRRMKDFSRRHCPSESFKY